MTGFPVCGKLMEFMKFVQGKGSLVLFRGSNLIASKCSNRCKGLDIPRKLHDV